MKKLLLGVFGFAMLAVGVPMAIGHSNGHESRTPADCEKLPGSATTGERGHCLECIKRPVKHHWHPDYPVGKRCRPDDGKP